MTSLPRLSYDALRLEAGEFLTRYNPSGKLPVPIELIIESDFEMSIIPITGLNRDCHTDGFLAGNMREIYIDERAYLDASPRARFTLAHELAHLLLHRDIFEGKFKSLSDYRRYVASIDEETYGWIEWQAASLGGLILAPGDALKREFDKALAVAQSSGLAGDSEPAVSYICSWIARNFEVSAQVISYRLNKDGLLKTSAPPDDGA